MSKQRLTLLIHGVPIGNADVAPMVGGRLLVGKLEPLTAWAGLATEMARAAARLRPHTESGIDVRDEYGEQVATNRVDLFQREQPIADITVIIWLVNEGDMLTAVR